MVDTYIIFLFIRAAFISVCIGIVVHFCVVLRGVGFSLAARIGVCLVAVLLSLAFIFARMIEGNSFWLKAMTFFGTFWSAFMLHAIMAWVLVGVFWLFNRPFRWLVVTNENRARWRYRFSMGIIGAAFFVCVAGWINAQFIVVREEKIYAPEGITPLRIVLLSDLHLGRLASVNYLAGIVDKIEPLSPDIVFFVGDILEYDLDYSEGDALAALLQRLKPRLGIWGVMGNHEYIGDSKRNKQLFDQMGIRILIDQWAELEVNEGQGDGGKILLIGRNDRHDRHAGRLPIPEVIKDAPKDALKILLDHQPYKLEEAEEAGVFLQLSGHTHNGQFFPINFVVPSIFEHAHGYYRRGQTHYRVTAGAGSWGARIRTTGRPEIVVIDLIAHDKEYSDAVSSER
ncbi:MAG: metallophosphoesterase [Betaproteobacteria bacterium]|nr:metallophosphoesterase [Betaproteobacteria bacterium]